MHNTIKTANTALIQSPLNYTGGKYKLLPQILPLFPQNIDCFVDLFCGGGNVGANVKAKKVLYNDINSNLINLLEIIANTDKNIIFDTIFNIIHKYGLSLSYKNGYAFYGCNSSTGLSAYNKKSYLSLRFDFNRHTQKDTYYYLMLYVLIIYSFNNQIRFNQKGDFNLPVGKRDFNKHMQNKLSSFIEKLSAQNSQFTHMSFTEFDTQSLTKNDFVYIDPPYLITCATYTEQSRWSEADEKTLLSFIDHLDNRGIRFALSNVLSNKGKHNNILNTWLTANTDRYTVYHLDYSYSNSNYQAKNRELTSDEVLILNYSA